MTTATAVVDALRPFDDTLDPQRLAEQASSSPGPMSLITLRQSDRDQVASVLGNRPGVVITPQAELLPTDEQFAPAIISEVKKSVVNDLDGQAGLASGQRQPERRGRRCPQRGAGGTGAVGHHQPGPRCPERRAERGQRHRRQEGDDRGDQALHRRDPGRRPERRRRRRRARPRPWACTRRDRRSRSSPPVRPSNGIWQRPTPFSAAPASIDIGHRTIPNYGGFDLGTVPMSRAFASSCNTTFAELASRMPPRGLTTTAAAVRHRTRLPDRGHHNGFRLGAADGQPGRTHRGRLRPGQGAGQPVRDGDGRGDGRGRQNPCAATDRGPPDHRHR